MSEYLLIELGDLLGDVAALEAADVFAAAADALVAFAATPQDAAQGSCHGLGIVGGDIEGVGAAGLLETGACAGDDGQTAADGLDDGDAEPLVTRGIDEGLGLGIELRQLIVGDIVEERHARLQTVELDVTTHLVGVAGGTAHDDQTDGVGEVVEGLDGQEDVLAALDGADGEDVAALRPFDRLSHRGEAGGAGLVDDGDAGGIDLGGVVEDVAPGALADGDDVVGLTHGLAELPGVDLRVEPVVVLGMTQEDEVVDGDDAADAGGSEAEGQLAGEAVEELYAVAQQVGRDVLGAPEGGLQLLRQGVDRRVLGITHVDMGTAHQLGTEIAEALVGGIQPQLERQRGEIVDQRAAVGTEARRVAEGAFGVETDDGVGLFICHDDCKVRQK